MTITSLDPRINRFQVDEKSKPDNSVREQFQTYEVFVQQKEDKPLIHVGVVHSPDPELAFILAKEQYSRRYTCSGLAVVRTSDVHTSPYTDGDQSVYDIISKKTSKKGEKEAYQVFHLQKRGKQRVHAGEVRAHNPEEALAKAGKEFGDTKVYNVWVIATRHFRFSDEDDKVIWSTLPDKTFREAIDYKGAGKIKEFKESQH